MVPITSSLFTQLLMDVQADFQFLPIVSSVAINTDVQASLVDFLEFISTCTMPKSNEHTTG